MPRPQTWTWSRNPEAAIALDPFDAGFALALFVNDAHFGGDGKQPQVTLRLSVKEESLFRWLLDKLPAGRLYGPYEYTYKDGGTRRFYQLMYRGVALREQLVPLPNRSL